MPTPPLCARILVLAAGLAIVMAVPARAQPGPVGAFCRVTPLVPVTDAALEFERGRGAPPAWSLDDIDADLDAKVRAFSAEMNKRNVRVVRTSGYRPSEYQRHLYEVRVKWEALRHQYEHDPQQVEACRQIQSTVDGEIESHGLKTLEKDERDRAGRVVRRSGQPLVNPPNHSAHQARPKSLAVDLSVAPRIAETRQVALEMGLAQPCAKDTVHFTSPKVGCDFTLEAKTNSPVRPLLTDPLGRRVGFDAARGEVVNEIGEEAYYTEGADGLELIAISRPRPGIYRVGGIGTGAGAYAGSLVVLDEAGNTIEARAWGGQAAAGVPLPTRRVPTLVRRSGRADASPPTSAGLPPPDAGPPAITTSTSSERDTPVPPPDDTRWVMAGLAGAVAVLAALYVRRRMRRPLCLVLCLLAPGAALAQPAAPGGPERVVLTWSEGSLGDTEYARLVRAIAGDVPASSWPTERVRSGEGLESLVDRLYDFYKVGSGRFARPMPQTVDALIELIARENGVAPDKLTAGVPLRIPPVPQRAHTDMTGATQLRFFDPRTKETAIIERTGVSLPRASSAAARAGTSTAVSLSARAAAAVSDLGPVVAPPPVPSPGSGLATGLAEVQLLQGRCPSTTTMIARSPYLATARARLKQHLARIKAAAGSKKLGFVDFDFASGHGAKVESAARWLLQELEVPELATFFERFDLEVTPGQTVPLHLQETLGSYFESNRPAVKEGDVQLAWYWFFLPSRNPDERMRTVPELLLQAGIWKQLRNVAWLNVSWQVGRSTSDVLPVNLSDLLRDRMVIVAAGNDVGALPADRKPQAAAATRLEFANVTYGSEAGESYGTTASPNGGRVDVMAPGCGFSFDKLMSSDEGSSFAAPVVAAASWLKHLLDGTPSAQMRVLLSRASTLLPPRTQRVIAGGVFDPARLIADPAPHYVDAATRAIVPVTDVHVVTDACGTFGARAGRAPGTQQLVVIGKPGEWSVIHRWEESQVPFTRVDSPCPVRTLVATAKVNGQDWRVETPDQFAKMVAHLAY